MFINVPEVKLACLEHRNKTKGAISFGLANLPRGEYFFKYKLNDFYSSGYHDHSIWVKLNNSCNLYNGYFLDIYAKR